MTSTTTSCIILIMTTITSDGKQRITLFVKPSVVKHARAQAVIEDLTLTGIVEKALNAYLPKEIIIKKL